MVLLFIIYSFGRKWIYSAFVLITLRDEHANQHCRNNEFACARHFECERINEFEKREKRFKNYSYAAKVFMKQSTNMTTLSLTWRWVREREGERQRMRYTYFLVALTLEITAILVWQCQSVTHFFRVVRLVFNWSCGFITRIINVMDFHFTKTPGFTRNDDNLETLSNA